MDWTRKANGLKLIGEKGYGSGRRRKLIWVDRTGEELRKGGIKRWWTVVRDRVSWKKLLREEDEDDGINIFYKI